MEMLELILFSSFDYLLFKSSAFCLLLIVQVVCQIYNLFMKFKQFKIISHLFLAFIIVRSLF